MSNEAVNRVVACVRLAVLAMCAMVGARRARADVLFQDDFEHSSTTVDGYISDWDGPPNSSVMYLTDATSHSGRRAVELRYVPGSSGASFMYRHFAPQDSVYYRWYQKWSPGFVWEPSATKMAILRPNGGYPQFYPEVLWATGQLAIQAQVIAEARWDAKNFYQNQGIPVTFWPGRWYCIEVYVKLNTPGSADGELAAWIDGELKLSYDGREFRGANPDDPGPSTAKIEAVAVSGHYGGLTPVPQLQFSWQDDHAASTERIGCRPVSDSFEGDAIPAGPGIRGWDGPGNPATMYRTDGMAHDGAHSVELAYVPGSHGAGYMFKHFPGMDGVYHRWYQRWSEGFRWDASATGLTGLGPRYGSPQFYPFVAGETGQLAIQAQVIAESDWGVRNFTQNEGEPVAFDPQRWYCVEVFVKLNTPGLADGELAAWIDGELKLRYTGRAFRGLDPADPAPPTARIESASIAGQYGATSDVPQLQFSWHDDHVVSSDRIGCEPAGLPSLPTEPSPP
jgi:hypothetical protein